MGKSLEEQRSRRREERSRDFYPSEKERKSNKKVKVIRKRKGVATKLRLTDPKPGPSKKEKKKRERIRKTEEEKRARIKILSVARKYQYRLKKEATEPEKMFKDILDSKGIKHRFQKILVYDNNSKFYILDFVIKKVVVELDGEHHYSGEQLKKDIQRDKFLRKKGYTVIRIRNVDLYRNWSKVRSRLKKANIHI